METTTALSLFTAKKTRLGLHDLQEEIKEEIISRILAADERRAETLIALTAVARSLDCDLEAQVRKELRSVAPTRDLLLKAIRWNCLDALKMFAETTSLRQLLLEGDEAAVLRNALLKQPPAMIMFLLLSIFPLNMRWFSRPVLLRNTLNPSRTSTVGEIIRASARGPYPSHSLVNLRLFIHHLVYKKGISLADDFVPQFGSLELEDLLFFFKGVITAPGVLRKHDQRSAIETISTWRAPVVEALLAKKFDVLTSLVEIGFSINARERQSNLSAWHYAIRMALLDRDHAALDLLIELGADLDDEMGVVNANALHLATAVGDFETVKKLIAAGIDLRRVCHPHHGCLSKCLGRRDAYKDRPECLEMFERAKTRVEDVAASRDFFGCRPIELAIYRQNLPLVQLLAKAMKDDGKGYAAVKRYDALKYCIFKGDVEVLQALLLAGANINVRDEDGNMPIHWAVSSGHAAIVTALLDAGASPSVRNYQDVFPYDLLLDLSDQKAREVKLALLGKSANNVNPGQALPRSSTALAAMQSKTSFKAAGTQVQARRKPLMPNQNAGSGGPAIRNGTAKNAGAAMVQFIKNQKKK